MTNECQHRGDFETKATITYLEDRDVWMGDVEVSCADCGEPFRFIGVNAGLALSGPAVSPTGTELRAPLEPVSAFQERQNRPQGFERYAILTYRTKQPEGMPKGIAHDRLELGDGCQDEIDAYSIDGGLVFKPGIPLGYTLCANCSDSRLADWDRLLVAEARSSVALDGGTRTGPPPAVEPVTPVVQASTPVAPLPPEEDDERPEGEPAPASAAIVLPPDPGDEPPTDTPAGVAVPRSRPRRTR